MPKIITIEVKGCLKCPFATLDIEQINVCCKDNKMKVICEQPEILNVDIPDWCKFPDKKEPLPFDHYLKDLKDPIVNEEKN